MKCHSDESVSVTEVTCGELMTTLWIAIWFGNLIDSIDMGLDVLWSRSFFVNHSQVVLPHVNF